MTAPTTNTTEEVGHHRGRALDANRDVALREAALELLAEIGYDRLTIDSVAARAHSSKATIYRRWPGKAELVVDALHCLKGDPPAPDTGSLRGDLEAIAQASTSSGSAFGAQLMLGLITALARDAELRLVFRERLLDRHATTITQALARAVDRGEVASDRNLELLGSVYPALMLRHLLTTGEIPGPDVAQRVIDDVIMPLATAPGRPTSPAR